MRYRAFISYKHLASGGFAERLELAIKAYAKPLWQPPMAIFRDEKYLKPGLDLPQMIKDALDQSEFLIYLASPEAAASPWVQDELNHWCSQSARLEKLIIVLTRGAIEVEEPGKAIDWNRTNAIPRTLAEFVTKVPLYLDCSNLVRPEQQTLLDPDFKKVVNAIAASFRGVLPIEMSGLEIIQHRKNLRKRNWLLASVVAMLLLAAVGGGVALQQTHAAAAQSRVSKASQLASEAQAAAVAELPQRALLLGAAAAEITRRKNEGITPQAEQTLRDLLGSIGGYGLAGHSGTIDNLVFLQGGSALLSVGKDGQAMLWRLDGDGGAKNVFELTSNRSPILAVQIRENEQRIQLVAQSGHVVIGDIGSYKPVISQFDLFDFNYDDACVSKVAARQVLQLSNHGVLRNWNLTDTSASQPVSRRVVDNALAGCAFSDDAQWLYAAADNRGPVLIQVGARGEGRQIPLAGATGGITAVAFNPQSRQLALSFDDGRILFWSLDSDRGLAHYAFQIKGKRDENLAIAYSHSGRMLATAWGNGTIELWKVDGASPESMGSARVPFKFYRGMEGQLSFELDDSLLIGSDGLRAAAAIPLPGGRAPLRFQVLHNHPSPNDVSGDRATPYAIDPRRPILVTAGDDHNAYIWKISAGTLLRRVEPLGGHDNDILALAFSPDGKWLATAGYDRVVRLWPADPPQWVALPAVLSFKPDDVLLNEGVPNPEGGVYLARFILDDEWFEAYGDSDIRFGRMNRRERLDKASSPSSDGELAGLDPKKAETLRQRSGSPDLQRRLIAELHKQSSLGAPDPEMISDLEDEGRALGEARSDGAIQLWNLQPLSGGPTLYQGLSGPITSLRVSTRYGVLAAVNKGGQIAIWRIGTPQAPQFVGDLARLLASASPLHSSSATPEATPAFDGDNPPPRITFISGARWLCIDYKYLIDLGSSPPHVWRTPDGAHEIGPVADCCIMQLFEDHFDFWVIGTQLDRPTRISPKTPIPDVTAYDYNSHLRRLALGLLSGRVMVIELNADGSVTRSANIASHDFAIRSLALSSDARIVAAGSAGGITMTELASDLSVARHIRLKGHRGDVHLLRFSPRDTWLLSGGEDGSVHVYPVSADQVVDLACIVAGRTLSTAEKGRLSQANLSDVCEGQVKR